MRLTRKVSHTPTINRVLSPFSKSLMANPLDRLLKPRFPSAAIGIEHDAASVVQLDRARNGFVVKRAASMHLPAEIVRAGFDTPNISDPAQLAAALTEVVTSAGLLRQRKWSTS